MRWPARISNRLCSFLLISAVMLAAATARCDEPELVGDWGRAERIVVTGATAFPADSIARELHINLDVLEAAHPLAALADYQRVLAEQAKAGYLHAGFANTKAETSLDLEKQQIVLHIDEGSKFKCGSIVVASKAKFDAKPLQSWLQAKHPPAGSIFVGYEQIDKRQVAKWVNSDGEAVELQDAAWQPGATAQFDDRAKKQIEDEIRRGMAELSYPFSQFNLAMPLDEAKQTAKLQIKFTDLGPQAVVGKVVVSGNHRDSQADIEKYLGVHPGMLLTETERLTLWHKLWLSGRYLQHDVELVRTKSKATPVELQIHVVEYDAAPALAKKLSPEEQTLMKFRSWILAYPERGDDLVFTFSKPLATTVVVSPREGLFVYGHPAAATSGTSTQGGENAGWPVYVLSFTPGALTYANEAGDKVLRLPLVDAQIAMSMNLKAQIAPEHPNQHFQLAIGLGLNDLNDCHSKTPTKMPVSIAPVYVFGLAHDRGAHCHWRGDILTVSNSDGLRLDIEKTTGRLVQLVTLNDGQLASEIDIAVEPHGHRTAHADFNKRLDRLTAKRSEAMDSKRPASSFIEFVLQDEMLSRISKALADDQDFPSRWDRGRAGIIRALAAGLLQPLDDYSVAARATAENEIELDMQKFEIPSDSKCLNGTAEFVSNACLYALSVNDQIFPRNSWPWVLVEDTALGLVGRQSQWASVSQRAMANDFGPLAHLAIIGQYNCGDQHEDTEQNILWYAFHASNSLSSRDFHRDVQPLLDSQSIAGKCTAHLANVLRKMDEADASSVGELLFGMHGDSVGDLCRLLKSPVNAPIEQALPNSLDDLWAMRWKHETEQLLTQICGGTLSTDSLIDTLNKMSSAVPQPSDKKADDSKPAELKIEDSLDSAFHFDHEFEIK